jgi:leucyl aminopeptidase
MMQSCFATRVRARSIPIIPLTDKQLRSSAANVTKRVRRWLEASGFKSSTDDHCLVASADGGLERVVVRVTPGEELWSLAGLPLSLPLGDYHLDADWDEERTRRAALGWGLGAYQFTRYKKAARKAARLVLAERSLIDPVERLLDAVYLTRDLINTAAEDMMPEHLSEAVAKLADEFQGEFVEIVGDALLESRYPAIHAVGRASVHPPRLLDLRWGDPAQPKITLVGKGVCFDSGGLDLKTASGMRLMKKDMGGGAHAIALARLVMASALPVRLRLLVPAVENAVAGNSYRPGDVIETRSGLRVEIDNTDAEGRVILCDALSEGSGERPEVLVDYATLTGAARVALGTELPAMFCNDEALASALIEASARVGDGIWRLPLHQPYRDLIKGKFSDIVNSATSPYAGAITAALFLESFVKPRVPWAHFDLMAWNERTRRGRPEGGEAMGLRAAFEYLRARFAAAG